MKGRAALAAATLAALVVSACTAIPVATLARLSTFDEKQFGALDAKVLRVRVAVPEGFAIDATGTRLRARVRSGSDERAGVFDLEPVLSETARRSAGILSPRVVVTENTLRLTPASVASFRRLQDFVAHRPADAVDLDVNVELANAAPGATSVTVWIDLLMSVREGYVTLIDGGTIELNRMQDFRP